MRFSVIVALVSAAFVAAMPQNSEGMEKRTAILCSADQDCKASCGALAYCAPAVNINGHILETCFSVSGGSITLCSI